MTTLIAKSDDFQKLIKQLDGLSNNIPQEVAIAAKYAGLRGRRLMAKQVVQFVRLPQKRVLKAFYVQANRDGATLVARGKFRIAFQRFKPVRIKGGAWANIYKGNHSRGEVPGAFNTTRKYHVTGRGKKKKVVKVAKPVPIAKLNGRFVVRDGKLRLPISAPPALRIVKVLREDGSFSSLFVDLRAAFKKTLTRRIRFLRMKSRGELNWQKK